MCERQVSATMDEFVKKAAKFLQAWADSDMLYREAAEKLFEIFAGESLQDDFDVHAQNKGSGA